MVLEEGGERMLVIYEDEFCTSPVERGLGFRCDLISDKSSFMTGIYFMQAFGDCKAYPLYFILFSILYSAQLNN